jgi:hypothetical protein
MRKGKGQRDLFCPRVCKAMIVLTFKNKVSVKLAAVMIMILNFKISNYFVGFIKDGEK